MITDEVIETDERDAKRVTSAYGAKSDEMLDGAGDD